MITQLAMDGPNVNGKILKLTSDSQDKEEYFVFQDVDSTYCWQRSLYWGSSKQMSNWETSQIPP